MENISRDLVRRGHEVDVYTANTSLPKEEISRGVRIRRFPVLLNIGNFAKLWPSFLGALRKEDYDVIHTHVYRHPHTTAVGLYSKIATKRAIISTHGPFHPPHVWGRLAPIVKIHDRFFGQTLRLFQKVLVLGELEFELLRRMHIPTEKIEIFANGVDSAHFLRPNPKSFLSKYNIDGQYICYLGRVHATKGLEFLMRSFSQIDSKSALVVAGSGEPSYIKSLKILGRRLGIHERLRFTGYISDYEKLQLLEGCDGLVLPSQYEPYGIVLLEAMAHAKPVIATYPGGTDFVSNNENGFLIKYGDVGALRERITTLLLEEKRRHTLGNNGYLLAKNSTWEKLVGRLEQIYEAVGDRAN